MASFGEDNGNAKLRRGQVRLIRKLHRKGWTLVDLGKRFGVRHTTVASVVNGETWSWLND